MNVDTAKRQARRERVLTAARREVIRAAKAWVHAQEDDRVSHEALRDAVLSLIALERT